MATNRPTDFDVEDKIRAEVGRIKREHPYAGDYRAQLAALVEMLFIKFGERAGAGRLVALLAENGRSPSTATAQDEIHKFWERIRKHANVEIRRPDLPDFLLDLFGDVAGKLWENALEQAARTYAAQRAEAVAAIAEVQARAAQAQSETDAARMEAHQAHEIAAAAAQRREEIAVELAAERSAREAAEQTSGRWEKLYREESASRRRDAEASQQTIGKLQMAIERLESELKRQHATVDDYKQQAARDRQARDKAEERSAELSAQLRVAIEGNAALVREKAVLEGRLASTEEQRRSLQVERDSFMQSVRSLELQVADIDTERTRWKSEANKLVRCYDRAKQRARMRRLRRQMKARPVNPTTGH